MKKILKKKIRSGQVVLEYMICMILAVVILVGMIEITSWTGRELVERRQAHESVLVTPIGDNQSEPLEQIRPIFFEGSDFEGIPIASNIFGGLLY